MLPFVMDYKRGEPGTGKSYSVVSAISPLVSNLRERGVTAATLSGHRDIASELQAVVADVCAMKHRQHVSIILCPI